LLACARFRAIGGVSSSPTSLAYDYSSRAQPRDRPNV
jgi:hypothetical protein